MSANRTPSSKLATWRKRVHDNLWPPDSSESLPANVEHFAVLVGVVEQEVLKAELTPFRVLDWSVPQEGFSSKLGRLLHLIYFLRHKFIRLVFPINPILTLLMLVIIWLEPAILVLFYGGLLAVAEVRTATSMPAEGYLLAAAPFFGLLLFLLILCYASFGCYWTYVLTLRKANLPLAIKLVSAATAIALLVWWWLNGSVRLWDSQVSNFFKDVSGAEIRSISQSVTDAWSGQGYLLFSVLIIYVPAIIHGALWLVRVLQLEIVVLAAVVTWLLSFHVTPTVRRVGRFLMKPIAIWPGQTPLSLFDLSTKDLSSLEEWAMARGEIVHNKLVPTTLLLAFLGLLANTTLGEEAVLGIVGMVREFFSGPKGLSDFWSQLRLAILLMLLIFPLVFIVSLLNEAYAMDFIKQSCILARSTKEAEAPVSVIEPSVEPIAKRPPRWLAWLNERLS